MGLISYVAVGVAALLGSVITKQASDEFKAWMPRIVDSLLHNAARKFPDDRERILEEWWGRIYDTPGEIGKLLFALSLQVDEEEAHRLRRQVTALVLIALFIPAFLMTIVAVVLFGGRPLLVQGESSGGMRGLVFNSEGSVGRLLKLVGFAQLPLLIRIFVDGRYKFWP